MKELRSCDFADFASTLGDDEEAYVRSTPLPFASGRRLAFGFATPDGREARFGEEALHRALAEAGLVVTVRVPDGAVVRRGSARPPSTPFWVELVRALRVVGHASKLRELASPASAARRARRLGARAGRPTRTLWERARLADAISLAERLRFARPNCLRRVLTELLLDAAAATGEDLVLGLDPRSSGHAWLCPSGRILPKEPFPVLFRLSPGGSVE